MKNRAVGWTLGAVLVLAAGGGYWWTKHRQAPADANASQAAGAPAAGASGAGGAISVTTVKAVKRDYPVVLEANGTVTALNTVDVRPQVATVITQVHIKEGQFVKAGQLMFSLDNRADQVNVTKAQAQLAQNQASLADAQRNLARSTELLAQNFISQSAVDTAKAQVDAQTALVASDRAAIEAARVGLGYTRISAPSSGRAGAINVYPGSYVQPGVTTLVTITQLDPISVAFNVPQRNLNDALRNLEAGGGKVAALLPDRRGELQGRLQFVDNTVDMASGTVKVKAEFPNPKQQLWPGAYVNVRVNLETLKDAIVVPQASIIRGPLNESVYVVGPDRKAVQKVVQVVYSSALDAIVKGVDAGDKVVVDGRQNLRPGVAVFEKPAASASPAAPASGASESPAELASAASGGTSSANSRVVTTASTTAP